MAELRKLESGNRRDLSLAEAIQQILLEQWGSDPNYERLLQHEYVDDISSSEQVIDGLYMRIYSQVDNSPDDRFIQSAFDIVSTEYLTKLFSPK